MQTWVGGVLSQVGAVDTMVEARMGELSSTQVVTMGWGLDDCKEPL